MARDRKIAASAARAITAVLALIGLPLLGVWLAGMPMQRYFEFPPRAVYIEHAAFNWGAFILLSLLILLVVAPFPLRVLRGGGGGRRVAARPGKRFPFWGWLGVCLTAGAWLLAWTRWEWFEPWQKFTFSPLWFGYILVVNGIDVRRSGSSLMTEKPLRFVILFLASALFWWYFEYLNRFVQNWIYSGIGDLSASEYLIFASLPFSTVLPAVMSTSRLLRSFPALGSGLQDFPPLRFADERSFAVGMLLLALAGLFAVGVWPNLLFPLLWLAPLLLIVALRRMAGAATVFSPMARGDWRRICRLALAGLVCGVFWEMWNYGSLARWEYLIPYVGRFRIFEMPLLGYAGYIPFGLECAVLADPILGGKS